MNSPSLPVRLAKEPMVDAIFEVRFNSTTPVSSVLPGVWFSKLAGVEGVENLPLGQLPFDVRSTDPQLKHLPITRLRWKGLLLLVGDHMAAVACRMPYPGWFEFRAAIIEAFGHLSDLPFISDIERWSIKYVDLFDQSDVPALEKLNVDIRVGGTKLVDQAVSLRAQIEADGFDHGVQVATGASVHILDGPARSGTVLEVDSIKSETLPVAEFIGRLPEAADAIHAANKRIFFACLSERGLKELEPEYE